MGKEQRQFQRIPESFNVTCRRSGALTETWRHVATKDLSAGGISFESELFYELADALEIQVALPGFHEPLVLRGRIVREQPLPSGVVDYAVAFMDVTPDQQLAIDEMVKFLSKPPDAA